VANAQNEKDRSHIDFIQALQKNWQKYYELRRITLFDFLENRKIDVKVQLETSKPQKH
jgi:hypothetical protein